MSGKTKIVVLKMKELVYAGIFLLLGILAIVLLVVMSKDKTASTQNTEINPSYIYMPGTYATSLTLNGSMVDVVVTVDATSILSIDLQNLDETVSVMYPLMEPALEDLAAQIIETQSIYDIEHSPDHLYTSMVLLNAITSALEEAKIEESGLNNAN